MQIPHDNKGRLLLVVKLCDDVLSAAGVPPCTDEHLENLSFAASQFGFLAFDRKRMVGSFKKYKSQEGKPEKDEAWAETVRCMKKIKGNASQNLARDFKN